MNATRLLTRLVLLSVSLAVGLSISQSSQVSSQPEGSPTSADGSASLAYDLTSGPTVLGAGHISGSFIGRFPCCGLPSRVAYDKIVFASDDFAALFIHIAGGQVHNRWTWRYYNPDGSVHSDTCFLDLRNSGEPGNDTRYVALVTSCPGNGQPWGVMETFPAGCPCDSALYHGPGPNIAGHEAASRIGTWHVYVDYTEDYTDPESPTIPAVAQDVMYLMHTPAVVLIHGYDSSCDNLGLLEQHIEQELAVSDDRVKCFDYKSRKGVASPVGQDAPGDLDRFLVDFRQELGMGPDEEIDLVAHSMGGLVARYYAQRFWWSVKIGSVSMLGTPNEGVWLAKLEKSICPIAAIPAAVTGGFFEGLPGLVIAELLGTKTCKAVENLVGGLAGFDPDSQAVHDMEPGSKILHGLNDGFVLPQPPELPQYRAHAGGHSSPAELFHVTIQPG